MQKMFASLLAGLTAICAGATLAAGAGARDQSFDADWRFFRGEATGAEQLQFDDSQWRRLAVPHDWSIEDLPELTNAVPELEAVTGEWRFHQGNDLGGQLRELDDSRWQAVRLPDTWEHHSNYTNDNVYGWFRRHLMVPETCRGRDFELLLGRIDDVDEVWLNGERLGGTGSFPPDYRSAWEVERRYRVPAAWVRGDGSDVLAVRVFDGRGNGGLVAAGAAAIRVGPFDPGLSEGQDKTGYVVGGIGWYRKHFAVTESNRLVTVRFDGVYMNAQVWLNGRLLGIHPHGYTSFEFELTPYLNPPGQENVLAVRVDNTGQNSRWYSGSGIYRHVWLTTTEPVCVPTWGVFVTTPEVSQRQALVQVAVEVRNATDSPVLAQLCVRVRDARGRMVGQSAGELHLAAHETRPTERFVAVRSPELWSPASPVQYVAEVKVQVAGKTTDLVSTRFGIRKIEVDAGQGFRLNGEALKLRGGCVHHDHGPLGAAAIDRAEERRVELLKANGFNAVRTSHNPPSPAFLEACDRLGLLVIDEAFDQWNEAKIGNQEDYHRFFKDWYARDIAAMVRRDRNHPSVIMWSIGNEIPEQFRAVDTARRLRQAVLAQDATRPVTAAICTDWGNVIRHWDQLSDPAFESLDVAGYNYLPDKYESDHARHPQRVMYGSESYPKDFFDYWSRVEQLPYVIGDFTWTAMDYFGEAGIGHSVPSNQPDSFFMHWPWYNAWCGDLDVCGFKKTQSFYRDVVWRRSPIEMAVQLPLPPGVEERVSGWGWPDESQSWNWPGQSGRLLQVTVYTRCETVRLELNGQIIGERPVSAATKLTAKFDVPYAPGELRAYGLIKGKVVAQTRLKTSGPPQRLKLTTDRSKLGANGNDLAFVTVEVVDANGQRVPDAEATVHFSVRGAGELAGQASGAPNDPASFRVPERKTFQGRCLAILRPTGGTGDIFLTAEAAGLKPATLTVEAR